MKGINLKSTLKTEHILKELNKFFKKPLVKAVNEKMEKKISSLLKKNFNPEQIFKKIKNDSDVEQISRFLYISGLDQTLLDFSAKKLEKHKPISWAYILKIFIKHKITVSKNLERLLFHHWIKNTKNQSSPLFACVEWGELSSEFQQMRTVYLQELEEQNLSEERDLLEQLAFVQAQGLIREEEEIIAKLLIIHPENSEYKKFQKDLDEKKALLTLQEQKKRSIKTDQLEDFKASLFSKKNLLNKNWLKKISLRAKQHPKETKNLALFLYFCHCPDKALDLLSAYVSKSSDYWFYLEWALETHQYTRGLELINRLFSEFKYDESSFLPLIYIKSQILYGLGKKTLAIEYLTSISQVHPDYKSTQYLLDKWSKNI